MTKMVKLHTIFHKAPAFFIVAWPLVVQHKGVVEIDVVALNRYRGVAAALSNCKQRVRRCSHCARGPASGQPLHEQSDRRQRGRSELDLSLGHSGRVDIGSIEPLPRVLPTERHR